MNDFFLSTSPVLLQDLALPGVSGLPDDHPEGPGKTGGLAAYLHHIHPQRHHWQLGLGDLPAVQSRGELLLAFINTVKYYKSYVS